MRILGGQRSSRQAALAATALFFVSLTPHALFSEAEAAGAEPSASASQAAGASRSAGAAAAASAPPSIGAAATTGASQAAPKAASATQTASSPSDAAQAGQDSELILILDLDGEIISDSFVAVQRNGRIFIPVCAAAEALSLSIHCLEDRAFGFILEESRPFAIDLKEGFAILGRRALPIGDAAFMQGTELFAELGELSRWWPIDFKYREELSTVKMQPRELLPAQGFKKRQRFKNPAAPALPRQYEDFTPSRGVASLPTVDLTSQLLVSGEGRGGQKSSTLNSLGLSGDLLYLSNETHLFAENDAIKRLDVSLSRRSDAGFRLGPVPVTQLVVGTSQAPTVDGIGAGSAPMYGVFLSNRPISGASKFLSHDINGYLPAGWDAELFHNGAPIAYQPPTQDGMYHFQNLGVQYGINVFKVVMHGPFGETRETEQTFLSDAVTPSGEFLYTLSGAWQTGLTPSETAGPVGVSNLTMTSDFGVAQGLTGSALLVRQTDNYGSERDYAGFGVRTALGYTLISLDLVQSFTPAGAQGELLTLRSSSRDVFGSAVQLEQRFFRDFVSLRFPKNDDPLLSQTLLKCSSSLSGWNEARFPLYAELGFDAKRSGALDWTTVWRGTGGWDGWNGALEADVSRQQRIWYASGLFQISTRVQGVSVRGQVGLAVAPEVTPSAVNLNADQDLGNGFQLNSGFMHDPVANKSELRVGVSKKFGLVGYAISATGGTSGAYSINLAVSSSLAADRFNRQALISAEALSPSGMIAVSALQAAPGAAPGKEVPLKEVPGIGFLVNGNHAATVPGSKGTPVIAYLRPDIPADVSVDLGSVEDPFMVPKEDGCHITPRAGVVSACRFTMITGGEIDGMVLVKLNRDEDVPLKGVRLDLLPAGAPGAPALASTQSQETGYYVFKAVKPGNYRIVIPEAEIARLKTYPAVPVPATMPEGGDQISGKDFLLQAPDRKP